MDGRDIGTVILPDADLKIFLVASPEARARRRFEELSAKGVETTYEAVLEEMSIRDKNDSSRSIAPCVQAHDALLLDNSDLTLEETADRIIKQLPVAIERKQSKRIYMTAHRFIAPLVRFFMGVHIEGKENIPTDGGVIVCANHIAVRDPILIAACFPRQIRYVAKKELFSVPIISSVIRTLGAIKIDRKGNDVVALRACTQLAKLGEAVAIFPQGHRYPGVNPATTPLRAGAAQIAFRSGCDILPVCIKVKNNKYGFFRRVTIVVGKIIPHDSLPFGNGGTESYEAVTKTVFEHIVELGDFSDLPDYQASK
jgi:1-acyl-sn-glycerol-3-phosphate acyltransferase